MSSRRPKVTAENPYGKSGLFKAILVKTRKTYSPLMIFKPFSLLRSARHGFSVCLLGTYLRIQISFLTIFNLIKFFRFSISKKYRKAALVLNC